MEIDFSVIHRLKDIQTQRAELDEVERELSKPMLRDMSLISELYSHYRTIYPIPSGRTRRAQYKRRIIFIILFLYAPSVLAGGRMPMGFRDVISNVLGISDTTFISHNIGSIAVMYNYNKYFKNDVDNVYNELTSWLEAKELIK